MRCPSSFLLLEKEDGRRRRVVGDDNVVTKGELRTPPL